MAIRVGDRFNVVSTMADGKEHKEIHTVVRRNTGDSIRVSVEGYNKDGRLVKRAAHKTADLVDLMAAAHHGARLEKGTGERLPRLV